MPTFFESVKTLITRPGRPGFGSNNLPQDNSGKPVAKAPESDIYPMEHAVVHRISSLAMLVKLRSDIAVMERPERFMVFPSWIQKLAYLLCVSDTVSVCAIRHPETNKVIEYHVFNDALKPTLLTNGQYRYSENDVVYTVLLSLIHI